MMKKLLKNLTLAIALGFATVSFGQMSFTTDTASTLISADGTLTPSLVYTFSNIPVGTVNVMNLRVYPGAVITGGGQVVNVQNANLYFDDTTADSDTAQYKTVTTPGPTGFISRTFTIHRLAGTIPVGTYKVALRVLQGGADGTAPITPIV